MAITTALIYAALRGGSGPIWFGPAHCLVHSFFSNNTLMRVHNFLWTLKLQRVQLTCALLQVHNFFVPTHCWRSTIFLDPHIAGGPLFFLDLQSAYCCGSKILLLVRNSFWTKHTGGSTKFSRSKPPFCRFIIFYGLHHITVVTAFSLRISAA